MNARDFTKLNIVIDSSSTKAASKELEKLGNVSTAAEGKIRKLASAVGALAGAANFSAAIKETKICHTSQKAVE
jgi:hypothetical protein